MRAIEYVIATPAEGRLAMTKRIKAPRNDKEGKAGVNEGIERKKMRGEVDVIATPAEGRLAMTGEEIVSQGQRQIVKIH